MTSPLSPQDGQQPDPPPATSLDTLLARLRPAATTEELKELDAIVARLPGPTATIEDVFAVLQGDGEFQLLKSLADRLNGDVPQGDIAYAKHRERARARQAEISAGGREIGPLPSIADPELKARCKFDLKLFFETCFPKAFRLGWSKNHLKVLKKLQNAILHGGKFALAMPRGRGKTTIFVRAMLWATLYGHHKYVLLVGANDDKALGLLNDIRQELRFNPHLAKMFPEACHPIRALAGIANRAGGQVLDGKPTSIAWSGSQLILPTVEGALCSGAIIEAGGLLTAIRGAHYTTPDGDILRPTLVLLDDPQTRESANSSDQTKTRYEILSADLAGLAGPDQKLSVCAAVTCIAKGDLSDTILDRKRCPEYRGERLKMIVHWPSKKAMKLWEEYFEIRRAALMSDDDGLDAVLATAATNFYAANRAKMDEEAEVDWETAIAPGDLSALQTAMNFLCEDEDSFWSERQNEPRNLFDVEEDFLTADAISGKLSNYDKRAVPIDVEYVTAFIDVHQRVLFWMVCGWSTSFEGYILDYGVYPKQNRKFFVQSRSRPTLQETYRKRGKEGSVYAGLQAVTSTLLSLPLEREDGAEMHINRMLIDAGWLGKTVAKFIRESPPELRSRMTHSYGKGYTENMTPISKFIPKEGEHIGEEWYLPAVKTKGHRRYVIFDSNYWKTFVQRRLATEKGDRGCLSIYGHVGHTQHDLLAQHLTAEFRTIKVGMRRADIWDLKPRTTENHWLDTLVGCAVAGSICGASETGNAIKPIPKGPEEETGEDPRVRYPDAA